MILRFMRPETFEVVFVEGIRHIRTRYELGDDGDATRCVVSFHYNGDWQGPEDAEVDTVRVFTDTGDLIEVR